MSLNKVGESDLFKKLDKFRKKLVKYRDYAKLLLTEKITLGHQWNEFEILRHDLQREYGGLKALIEEYGGSTVVGLSGHHYDVFDLSLVHARPTKITLVGLEKAIMLVHVAMGKLKTQLDSEEPAEEAVYRSGKPYDAYKHIKGIIASTARELTIIDPYVDGTLFTLLENVQSSVQIQILTQSMQGDFKLAGQKFKDQREKALQGKLEVRKSGKFHDRFIVVDDRFFHLGASIKDAGNKMCAMNEFEGADIKATLRETISTYWDEAEVVL